MLRLILIALFLFSFLILSIPVLLVEWILGKSHPAAKDKSCKAIVDWGFRCVIFLAGTRVIVRGKENIPTDTAVLYVGNHRSYFDIVLTLNHFPGITGYVAKVEMLRYPLLNLWMKNIHCLFLDRSDIKKGMKTILEGIEDVKSGISLCIFPEGTRNKTPDTFLPFHEGSFKIAEKGGVPVVPMTIVNSASVFEDHLPKVKRATVIIEFQKPVMLSELDKAARKNVGTTICSLISERYFALKQEYDL